MIRRGIPSSAADARTKLTHLTRAELASAVGIPEREMLVQEQPLRARCMTIPAEIPSDLEIERVGIERLPSAWRDPAAQGALRAIGREWATGLATAVLAVPSAVIPSEGAAKPVQLLQVIEKGAAQIRPQAVLPLEVIVQVGQVQSGAVVGHDSGV